jgi:hypothetical protein
MWPGGAWHAALWEARGVLRQAEGDIVWLSHRAGLLRQQV